MKYDIIDRKGCTITIRLTDDMMDVIESLRREIPASKQMYPPATFSEAVRVLLQKGIESHVSQNLFDQWRRDRASGKHRLVEMGVAGRNGSGGMGATGEDRAGPAAS